MMLEFVNSICNKGCRTEDTAAKNLAFNTFNCVSVQLWRWIISELETQLLGDELAWVRFNN